MFDKNFKIKVSGNWCEYQPNKHIDLREIISFECWADQLGNPYRFHLKNGSYHYIERYEIGKQIENVLKEQQAKVEELQNNINLLNEAFDIKEQLNQKLREREDELQKRVDAALKETQFALQYVEDDMRGNHEFLQMAMIRTFKALEQALKGDQYDEHHKKAEEAISKGASLTNHRIEL